MVVQMDDVTKYKFLDLLSYGQIDGDHHKAWAIDQIARLILGVEYDKFVIEYQDGEDGPFTYEWSEGIPP